MKEVKKKCPYRQCQITSPLRFQGVLLDTSPCVRNLLSWKVFLYRSNRRGGGVIGHPQYVIWEVKIKCSKKSQLWHPQLWVCRRSNSNVNYVHYISSKNVILKKWCVEIKSRVSNDDENIIFYPWVIWYCLYNVKNIAEANNCACCLPKAPRPCHLHSLFSPEK